MNLYKRNIVIIIMSMMIMHIYCCKRDSCSDNLFDNNDNSDCMTVSLR